LKHKLYKKQVVYYTNSDLNSKTVIKMVYAKRKTVQTGWTETGRKTTFHRLINALTTFSQHFTDNASIHSASTENETNIYHAHIVAFEQGNSLAIETTCHNTYR